MTNRAQHFRKATNGKNAQGKLEVETQQQGEKKWIVFNIMKMEERNG
jgi:hypothetical protein